jgi:hypothetical protein
MARSGLKDKKIFTAQPPQGSIYRVPRCPTSAGTDLSRPPTIEGGLRSKKIFTETLVSIRNTALNVIYML